MDTSRTLRAKVAAFASLVLALLAFATPAFAEGFLIAIHEDRTEAALALLKKGADPSATNRYGVSPLSLACTNGNARLVEALLAAGADPNEDGRGDLAPLILAARNGSPEPIRLLLKAGAHVNDRDDKRQSPLHFAAVEGHAKAVELLLKAGAKRYDLSNGYNAFFLAAREGHLPVIDLLLADGTDPDSVMGHKKSGGRAPRLNSSALLLAIENGHFEVATRLLEAGADPNDMRTGYTPLHTLSRVRKPKRGDGIDGAPPPRESGSMGSLQFVEVLLKHGADINARLKGGSKGGNHLGNPSATPFLLASYTCDLPFMKCLIENGANFQTPNFQGRTPLLAAAGVALGPEADEAASVEDALLAVDYLLELGADIDVVDDTGETVMHAAAYKQAPKLVHLLAKRGADITVWNQKNKRGWTPLLISQGFRNGNYKPSEPTMQAISEVMRTNGIEPPAAPPRPGTEKKEKYTQP